MTKVTFDVKTTVKAKYVETGDIILWKYKDNDQNPKQKGYMVVMYKTNEVYDTQHNLAKAPKLKGYNLINLANGSTRYEVPYTQKELTNKVKLFLDDELTEGENWFREEDTQLTVSKLIGGA